ncbi:MAG: type II toxin-antitoxin system RelE/ParE family toxin [Thermoanaerobaculia bacterium]|jgi:proteic killer suppression protein
MIRSFKDGGTEAVYHGEPARLVRQYPADVLRIAVRKLDMLNAATRLDDLASPPGNRLEALRGDRKRHHSIRVNDQWRIVFRWDGNDALLVELCDYH